jgi:tetratricopeptide (TPR) repeat protein
VLIELSSVAELDLSAAEDLHGRGSAAARRAEWSQAAALLRQAEGLWRGQPLADVPSDALQRRALPRLDELRAAVIEQRIEAELNLGRAGELVGELRTLAATHPLRERYHAQLMLALYRSQRRSEALAAYQDARKVLREQLGADPTAELRELHRQILSGDPVLGLPPSVVAAHPEPAAPPEQAGAVPQPAAQAPHGLRQLPVAPRGFAGRDYELKRLDELSAELNGDTALSCAVSGTAGVGKTSLALHWAHRNAAVFPDGQLYVNLRGFDPGEQPMAPEAALHDLLTALGVSAGRMPTGLEPRSTLYRSLLAGRRVLVVLDNARDARQVRPLLPAGPGSMTLITSRAELRGLVIAEGARPLPLELMGVDEAGQLLTRKLGAEQVHEDLTATGELIDLCARLPLALSVAAAYIDSRRHATIRSFADDLRAASASLDMFGVDDPLTDLRTVLSCSVSSLSEGAGHVFRLLGLHPGPDISASAVAALAGLDMTQADRALCELVDANLLAEPTAGRYACHDLLRAYAQERAHELAPEAAREARERLLGWYVHAASAANHALDYADRRYPPGPSAMPDHLPEFSGQEQADAWFTAERENIAAAVGMAAEHAVDPASWDLAMIPWNYYYRRRLLDDWLHVLNIALTAATLRGTPLNEQSVLHMRGLCHRSRNELPEAIDAYEKGIAIARTLPGVRLHYKLENLGMAYLYSGRGSDALDCLAEALAEVEAAENETVSAALLNNIGDAHRHLGQYEQALPYLDRGLATAIEQSDSIAAYVLATLGETHLALGRHREAADYSRRAADMFRSLNSPLFAANFLENEANALIALGDRASARRSLAEALELYETLDHPQAALVRARLAEAL